METLVAFDLPLPADDIAALERILREQDVLVSAFDPSSNDPYALATYLIDQALHGSVTVALTDRNILTRWLSLARGRNATEPDRIAAAVMAFAQCAHWMLETNLALYELVDTQSQAAASDEWGLFQGALEVPTGRWTDVALGRTNSLLQGAALDAVEPLPQLTPRWDKWQIHYAAVLKLATLELEADLQPVDRFIALLHWMHKDFLFDSAAISLAMHYLSPGSRQRGLLKGLRSPIRERALEGVSNATWDLVVLAQWYRMSSNSDQVIVLASQDRALRDLVRTAFAYDATRTADQHLEDRLLRLWGPDAARPIMSEYSRLVAHRDDPQRLKNRGNIDPTSVILVLEEALLRWSPSTPD